MYVHQFKQQRIFPIAKEDDIEVMATFKAIVEELGEAGHSTTAIKQFITLCECGCFEKRFQRGCIQVTLEDILEGWYLMRVSDSQNIVDEIEVNGEMLTPKHPLIPLEGAGE
jgi:hypothetical protein